MDIDGLRSKIDAIDEQIVQLICERLNVGQQIGALKKQQQGAVLDTAREQKIIQRLSRLNPGPLNAVALRHIFAEIISASREIQAPQTIAFLGPEATYTHIAAMNHFGHSATYAPMDNIQEVFKKVSKKSFNYGVVPVENSIEGSVNYTLDLFFESDLKICAEIYQAVSHDLVSVGGELGAIQRVYSHPHALAQCRQWLRRHLPNARCIECSSTAQAAREVVSRQDAAAISSRESAHLYGLKSVASRIEDSSRNTTRFLVIGPNQTGPTGQDKTSIMFSTPHRPGALYSVLQPLSTSGVNMVKLESRPSKYANWSYFFFVDLEGHLADRLLRETLQHMQTICEFFKVLGSYPMVPEGMRQNEVTQPDDCLESQP